MQSRNLTHQLGLLWDITGANLKSKAVNTSGLSTMLPVTLRGQCLFWWTRGVEHYNPEEVHRNFFPPLNGLLRIQIGEEALACL